MYCIKEGNKFQWGLQLTLKNEKKTNNNKLNTKKPTTEFVS